MDRQPGKCTEFANSNGTNVRCLLLINDLQVVGSIGNVVKSPMHGSHLDLVLVAQGALGMGVGSGDRSAGSPLQTVDSEMCLTGPAFFSRDAPSGALRVTQSDCELVPLVQPIQHLSSSCISPTLLRIPC